jgi:hypothetical protein
MVGTYGSKPFILPQLLMAMETKKLLVLTLASVLSVGLFATSFRTGLAFAAEQCQTVNGVQQCEGGTGGSNEFGPGLSGGGGSHYYGIGGNPTTQVSGGGGGISNPLTGSPGGFGGHTSCVDYTTCTSVGSPSQRSP